MTCRVRKLNRLAGWDYKNKGYYFVTLNADIRGNVFGEVVKGSMVLNEAGKIVWRQLNWIVKRYSNIRLDVMVVMPDHVHGIFVISDVGNGRDRSVQTKSNDFDSEIKIEKSLSGAIGAFKTTSSKIIHQLKFNDFRWHKSFHDRIIRNEKEYLNIKRYILDNPKKWGGDR